GCRFSLIVAGGDFRRLAKNRLSKRSRRSLRPLHDERGRYGCSAADKQRSTVDSRYEARARGYPAPVVAGSDANRVHTYRLWRAGRQAHDRDLRRKDDDAPHRTYSQRRLVTRRKSSGTHMHSEDDRDRTRRVRATLSRKRERRVVAAIRRSRANHRATHVVTRWERDRRVRLPKLRTRPTGRSSRPRPRSSQAT